MTQTEVVVDFDVSGWKVKESKLPHLVTDFGGEFLEEMECCESAGHC